MSRLKEVLERRLFRNNGMLGSENPQGILNSSNELANTVRMQNGGVHIARAPGPLDVPGMPSEFLFPPSPSFKPIDPWTNPPEELDAKTRRLLSMVGSGYSTRLDEQSLPEDKADYRQAYPDIGPDSALSEEERHRALLKIYNDFTSDQRSQVGELVAQGSSSEDAISRIAVASDPRRAFSFEALRRAEDSEELGAEELKKEFPPSIFERKDLEALTAQEDLEALTAQEVRDAIDRPDDEHYTPARPYYEDTYEGYLKGSAEEKDQEQPRTEDDPARPVTQETVNRLFESGPAADPSDKKETMLSVLRKRLEESRGGKVDKAELKKEIDALLPAIQNDPVSEGLMAMIVGAKIAEKGVAAGLSESLPQAMEFFNNQHAQKQAREREVAAAALTEGFSREKEQRTNEQALLMADYTSAQEMQTFRDQEAIKDFYDTERYVVINDSMHNVDGEDIKVPFGTPLSLNSDQLNQLGSLGVQVVRVEDYDAKMLEYLGSNKNITADSMLAQMTGKQRNELYESPTDITAFDNFGSPYKFSVMRPKAALILSPALRKKLGDHARVSEGELLGLHRGYENAIFEGKNLYDDIRALKGLAMLSPAEGGGAMSGWPRLKREILQAARASKIPGIDTWASELIGETGRDITQLSEFEVRARHILAKIAPLLLGESGKTISDADRARVAQALGFNVTYDEGKMNLTAPTESYFKDERVVIKALEVTMQELARNMDQVTAEYIGHLERFGLKPNAAEYSDVNVPTKQEREEIRTLFADLTT